MNECICFSLTDIIIMIVATDAYSELLVESTLFDPVRKIFAKGWFFGQLFTCVYCMSIWSAIFVVSTSTIFPWMLWCHFVFMIHRASNLLNTIIKIME